MTRLRFQFFIGLLLVVAIVGFSATFLRYTAQIAKEMPQESVQMLQQAATQAEQNHKAHGTPIIRKFIRFVQNIQKNSAHKIKEAPSVSTRVLPTFAPAPKPAPQEPAIPPALQDPDQKKRVTDPLKQ